MIEMVAPRLEKIDSSMSVFPDRLRTIHQPPKELYVWGAFRDFQLPSIAIVGTRRCTSYGEEMARRFGMELARRGVVVVSGLARGIDQAAHIGVLEAGGVSIAVVPGDMPDFLARAPQEIQCRLLAQGAMISEWPLDYPVESWQFPVRNRLIAGLSLGVLVVEAPEKSGALITVTHALDQGKDVFAIPGDIGRESSRGTNRLIQDGAKLVMSVEDILCEIEPFRSAGVQEKLFTAPEKLSGEERLIRDCLLSGPKTLDGLIDQCELSSAALSELLVQMELEGTIRRSGGRIYWRGKE